MDYKICHVYSAEILYESFSGIYTRRLFIDWKQIISSFNTSTGLTSKRTFSLCSQRWDFLVKVLTHLRQMGAPVLVLHVCAAATWSMSFDSISSCRWTMGSPPVRFTICVSNSLLYWTVSHSENGLLGLVHNYISERYEVWTFSWSFSSPGLCNILAVSTPVRFFVVVLLISNQFARPQKSIRDTSL